MGNKGWSLDQNGMTRAEAANQGRPDWREEQKGNRKRGEMKRGDFPAGSPGRSCKGNGNKLGHKKCLGVYRKNKKKKHEQCKKRG